MCVACGFKSKAIFQEGSNCFFCCTNCTQPLEQACLDTYCESIASTSIEREEARSEDVARKLARIWAKAAGDNGCLGAVIKLVPDRH